MSGPSISHLLMRPKDVHCVWVPRGDGKNKKRPGKVEVSWKFIAFFLVWLRKRSAPLSYSQMLKEKMVVWLVVTTDFLIFTPKNWGRWTHFDEHIFQRGWFNHQLVVFANLIYIHIWHVHWSVPPGSLAFCPPKSHQNPIGIRHSSNHSFALAMLNLGCVRISFFRITSGFRNLHPLKLQV